MQQEPIPAGQFLKQGRLFSCCTGGARAYRRLLLCNVREVCRAGSPVSVAGWSGCGLQRSPGCDSIDRSSHVVIFYPRMIERKRRENPEVLHADCRGKESQR